MATNFPTSVDVLTNPVSNDSLNSPSHSTQHANANDAIEAIETTLFAGGINYTGLVHLNTTTFSASSSVNITNVFNTTYDNYLVVLRTDVSTTMAISCRMGIGGTPNSSAGNYKFGGFLSAIGSSSGSFTGATDTSFKLGEATVAFNATLNVFSPFIAKNTGFISSAAAQDYYNWALNGNMSVSTSYTDFNLICSTGNMTGTVRIYGHRNS